MSEAKKDGHVFVSVGQIFALSEVLEDLQKVKMDFRKSKRILNLVKWARPYRNEVLKLRSELAPVHGKPVSEGSTDYTFTSQGIAAMQKAMEPLSSRSVEYDDRLSIPLDDIRDLPISAASIEALEIFTFSL